VITPSAFLDLFLAPAFVLVLSVWAAVSLYLVLRALSAGRRDRSVKAARAVLGRNAETGTAPAPAELQALLEGLAPDAVLKLAATAPDATAPAVAAAALERLGEANVEALAVRPSSARNNWKRIAGLQLLSRGGSASLLRVLERVVSDRDLEISGAALALLARVPERKAAALLIGALKDGRHPGSRVATYLDQFPLPIGESLRPLLHHPDIGARYWGATLLARQLVPGIDAELAALTGDASALVRRAAVASLATLGGSHARDAARALLGDDVWYVRAHAARALAETDDPDAASAIAPLLADRDWWVRLAAKESLQRLGGESWSILVPYLDHRDTFARNGAAEVLQNTGVLDSLIVMEAATSGPSPAKIDMLRKIAAAGGTRMTEALLERVDAETRPRVRALLQTLGLEPVGAGS